MTKTKQPATCATLCIRATVRLRQRQWTPHHALLFPFLPASTCSLQPATIQNARPVVLHNEGTAEFQAKGTLTLKVPSPFARPRIGDQTRPDPGLRSTVPIWALVGLIVVVDTNGALDRRDRGGPENNESRKEPQTGGVHLFQEIVATMVRTGKRL